MWVAAGLLKPGSSFASSSRRSRKMQIIESAPDTSALRTLEGDLRPRPMIALNRADLRDLSLLAWAIFAFVITIAIHGSLRESEPRDFVYFYSIGHLLNHYSPVRLYDFGLQQKIVAAMQQAAPKVGYMGPFAYPPHLAMLFQPFAMLPYWVAFRLWMAVSLALYLTALSLTIKRFCSGDLLERSLFFFFGLSFWPFINWILLGGQLSAIGLAAMALAIYWEDLQRHFLSGLALSVCTYKPTLLLLILPMLVVIRRPKTLAGFATGALTLVAATTLAGGPQIWVSYISASAQYAGISHVVPVRLDVRALAGAIPDSWRFAHALLLCACGLAGGCLAAAWCQARRYTSHRSAALIWATTITWTLLLNVYVPVYDSVQVIISIIATAAILVRYAPRLFFGLCLLLLVSSYFSAWLSGFTGWQFLTPVLAGMGILQLSACRRGPDKSPVGS